MAPVTWLAGGSSGVVGAVRAVPTGVLYSTLLLLHVLCAVVGFGTMVVTGVQSGRARRGPRAPGAEGVRRYFRPGVNWAGRTLYGVPGFGFGLIAASKGAFDAGDGFVVVGLTVWLVSAVLAEVVVWPGERRIQSELTERWGPAAATAAETAATASAATSADDRSLDRDCRNVAAAAAVLGVLFLAATVIMIGKP